MKDYPQGSPSPNGSGEMERESSGDDLEVGEETVSIKDLSLGSMDASFLQPKDAKDGGVRGVRWLLDLDQVLKGCDLSKHRAEDVKNIVRYFTEKERVLEALPASFKVPEVSLHLPCITFDGLTNKGKGFSSRILWFMTLLHDKHEILQEAMAGMNRKSKRLVGELILTAAEKLVQYV